MQASKKQIILKSLLIASFILGLQQNALAYSPEATDALFKNIIVFGFFGIFIVVMIILFMFKSKDKYGVEVNVGTLLLKAIGISVLVFILLAVFAISAMG